MVRASRVRRGLGLLPLLCVLAGCGGDPQDVRSADRRPDVVLIVIDTLRADRLGAYGHAQARSPNLDALARRGSLFSDATTTSSWTRPAIASLFTGRLPSALAIHTTADALDPAVPTVAERLRERGYRAVGVTANFVHVSGQSGLARGFDPFVSVAIEESEGSDMLFELVHEDAERPPARLRAATAGELNERVLGALDGLADLRERPLFLYVHYMDPHSGYLPPEGFGPEGSGDGAPATSDYVIEIAAGRRAADAAERRRLLGLYDGEIAYLDEQVGALLAALEARGLARQAVVIVVSDHGEEFAEHGGFFHGLTLHRELLHVPLILHDRRAAAPGCRRDEPVDLLDVAATLLAIAGVDAEGPGRDLLAPGPLPARGRVAELEHDRLREDRVAPVRHRRAFSEGSWKAIVDARGELALYRTDRDPGERSPVAADDPAVPAALRARARELVAQAAAVGPEADAAPGLSPEERARLRALGYAD